MQQGNPMYQQPPPGMGSQQPMSSVSPPPAQQHGMPQPMPQTMPTGQGMPPQGMPPQGMPQQGGDPMAQQQMLAQMLRGA